MTDLKKYDEKLPAVNTDIDAIANHVNTQILTQGEKGIPWPEIIQGHKPRIFDYLQKDRVKLKYLVVSYIIRVCKILDGNRMPSDEQIAYMSERIATNVIRFGWTAWDLGKFFNELPDGTWGDQYGTIKPETVMQAMRAYHDWRTKKIQRERVPEVLAEPERDPSELADSEKTAADVQEFQRRAEERLKARYTGKESQSN
jgi:hypothetical protein